MFIMNKKYPDEFRQEAVRLVHEKVSTTQASEKKALLHTA
jgi:transposase-like protein